MSPRNVAIFGILTACAVVTWLAANRDEVADTATGPAPPVDSGYYVLDAVIFGNDEFGAPRYEIRAAEARQSERTAPIRLIAIEVAYAGEDDQRWRITADLAHMDPVTNAMAMQGNVVASRADDESGDDQPVALYTDELAFDPAVELISTLAAVEFRVGTSRLTAVGMQASLRDDTIRLESNVRGQYVP